MKLTPEQHAVLKAGTQVHDTHLIARQLGRTRQEVLRDFEVLTQLGLCRQVRKNQYQVLLTPDAVGGAVQFHLDGDRITATVQHPGGTQRTSLSVDTGHLPYGTRPDDVVQALNALGVTGLAYPVTGRGNRVTWTLSILGGRREEVDRLLSPD